MEQKICRTNSEIEVIYDWAKKEGIKDERKETSNKNI